MTTHSITLERARALLHALKRVDSPAEREAMAELAQLRQKWRIRWIMRVAKPVLYACGPVRWVYGFGVTPMGDGALFDSWEARPSGCQCRGSGDVCGVCLVTPTGDGARPAALPGSST